ncbi:MAG: 50S ribosomal protein L2 [Promethearchaeota archaeon]
MGKKLLVQRRGRGTMVFKAAGHKRIAPARYPALDAETRKLPVQEIIVLDLLHEPGRGLPLAKLQYEGQYSIFVLPAVEGLEVGEKLQQGENASLKIGNILPIGKIPDGMWCCNVELQPGDGGALARSSGTHVTVTGHRDDLTIISLPSGKTKTIKSACLATIGVVAAGGRTERPFVKAGVKYGWKRAKGHKWPKVRGVAMNVHSHPHGGGAHQRPGRPTTVSRHSPPGRKVGLIAARRTGPRVGRRAKQS